MHLRYIFLFVSLITTSKDEQDTSYTPFLIFLMNINQIIKNEAQ